MRRLLQQHRQAQRNWERGHRGAEQQRAALRERSLATIGHQTDCPKHRPSCVLSQLSTTRKHRIQLVQRKREHETGANRKNRSGEQEQLSVWPDRREGSSRWVDHAKLQLVAGLLHLAGNVERLATLEQRFVLRSRDLVVAVHRGELPLNLRNRVNELLQLL